MNDIRNNYNRDGYVLLKSFFNKEQVDDLKEDAKKVFIRQMHKQGILSSLNPDEKTFETAMYQFFKQDTEGYINCSKTCQYLVSFYKFALDEKLLEYVNRLGVKEPSINTRPVMNLSSKHLAKSEVYYKVPAHQDWRTGQGSLNAITIWVPLVDVDIKLGALEVIPRSHLWGLYDTVQDDL
jgi:phytanoyl-CoA hydroxylase